MEERGKAKGFLHKMTNLTMIHSRSKNPNTTRNCCSLLLFMFDYLFLESGNVAPPPGSPNHPVLGVQMRFQQHRTESQATWHAAATRAQEP